MAYNFERVRRFAGDKSIHLPTRATRFAAGYDFEVAEDILIPSSLKLLKDWGEYNKDIKTLDLDRMGNLSKTQKVKPTLVPTGIKVCLDPGEFLQLSVRSSCPLKYWLILANGVGIIDADYYSNPNNDGEIFFQIINLSPYDIQLHKGDKIGQGIILKYGLTDNDIESEVERQGGFGSTL